MIVGASCTAELIQDDPADSRESAWQLPIPVMPLELPAYQKKENWGAAETFYHLVAAPCTVRDAPKRPDADHGEAWRRMRRPILQSPRSDGAGLPPPGRRQPRSPRCSNSLGVEVNGGRAAWRHAGRHSPVSRNADFNVVLYPEIAGPAATWLERTFGQPWTTTVPIGVGATNRDFVGEVAESCRHRIRNGALLD